MAFLYPSTATHHSDATSPSMHVTFKAIPNKIYINVQLQGIRDGGTLDLTDVAVKNNYTNSPIVTRQNTTLKNTMQC